MMKVMLEKDERLPIQTHRFAWSLARAMQFGGATVQLISVPQVSNYPKMRKVYFRGERFTEGGFVGQTLSFVNIIGLKHITRIMSCIFIAMRAINRHGSQVIIVHGVHSPFLWFAALMRRKDRNIVVVLTDPPGVLLPSDIWLVRMLKAIDVWLVKVALKRVNGVIALTQALIDDFAPAKLGLVLPGFLDRYLEAPLGNVQSNNSNDVFQVAYAGGLSVAYGVDRLIDAVVKIEEIPIRLDLYGKGELETHIKALAVSDVRIRYGGSMAPDELAKHLRFTDLLVNPRPTHLDFVRHSFPSKLIEYMALGVPVLSTRLPGIPEEYLEHMMVAEEATAEGIRKAILGIIDLPLERRKKLAHDARNFVLLAASEKVQGRKILSFFNLLMQ
jgi:glycosyltransferase involved in cell wall biosynthesis